MAFPTDWTRKAKLTISAAGVGTGGVTDYTIPLSESSLPSDVFAEANSDGSDLRASIAEDGTGPLTVDVIDFDADAETAVLRVGTVNLSSAADNALWLWWGNASALAQTGSAAYDSGWAGYWPDGGGTDRTANGNDGTAVGGVTVGGVAGQFGRATDFDGVDDHFLAPSLPISGASAMMVATWAKLEETSNLRWLWAQYDETTTFQCQVVWLPSSGKYRARVDTTSGTTTVDFGSASLGEWRHLAVVYDGSQVAVYVDGELASFAAQSGTIQSLPDNFYIGSRPGGEDWQGEIDDMQVHSVARDAAWTTTEHHATNSPATFASAGTPQAVASAFNPAWAAHVNTFIGTGAA